MWSPGQTLYRMFHHEGDFIILPARVVTCSKNGWLTVELNSGTTLKSERHSDWYDCPELAAERQLRVIKPYSLNSCDYLEQVRRIIAALDYELDKQPEGNEWAIDAVEYAEFV